MTRFCTPTGAARRTLSIAVASALAVACSTGSAGAFAPRPMLAGRAPSDRAIASTVARGADVRDLGRAPSTMPVRVGVLLRYQHASELEALVRLQGQRTSPYYHRYLTPAQWNAYFAPTAAQYAKVAAAMRRAGFIIDRSAAANRGLVLARGRAASAETYFRTRIDRVVQHGSLRYANVTTAVMPDELRQDSVSVLGLHSIDVAHAPKLAIRPLGPAHALRMQGPAAPRPLAGARVAAAATAKPITNATPAPNPNPDPTLAAIVQVATAGVPVGVAGATADYGPYAMAVAYDYPVLHGWDGAGRRTGSVISADFANSDINGFISTFKLPRAPMPASGDDALTHRVRVDGGSTGPSEGEETLDAEAIIGLAPGTNFYEYLIPALSDLEVVNAYNQADSDALVDGLNSSFGGCETDDPSGLSYSTDYVALQGAAKGITYAASTGDTGSNGCAVVMNGAPGMAPGVEGPASGYYFTGVGGTALTLNPNSGAVLNEMGWINGGGGVSKLNPLPDWQAATIAGATSDGNSNSFVTPAQNSGRNLPDLALFSDQQDGAVAGGFAFFYKGAVSGVGGTSLSSPLWIAMQSEIDEIQGAKNGWVNPRLYAIYDANGYVQFRDVILGNNQAYTDVPGYDNIAGIGAPLGFELAGTE